MSDVVGTGIELHVPRDPTEMAVLACMPAEHAKRTVVIAPRMNKTLKSGGATGHLWQISWKNEERWSNPLMGWTSTADPLSNLKLTFDTEEEAVAFAQKNGWKFETRAPVPETTVELGTMTYSHAFLPKKVVALVREKGPKNGVFTQVRFSMSVPTTATFTSTPLPPSHDRRGTVRRTGTCRSSTTATARLSSTALGRSEPRGGHFLLQSICFCVLWLSIVMC